MIPINPRTIKSLNLYFPVHSATINNILSLFILSLEIYFTQLRRPFGQRKWLLLICFISE